MSDGIDTISRLNRRGVQWTKSPLYSHVISNPNAPLYYVYRHYHVKVVDGVEREFSYVGFAGNPTVRLEQHVVSSKNKNDPGYGYAFARALRKRGLESFLHEVLFASDDYDLTLNEMEPLFILEFRSYVRARPCFGYNLTTGGQGNPGVPLSEDYIAEKAAAFCSRNGSYPKCTSRSIVIDGHPGDTWKCYDKALRRGGRGLPGGSSLPKLLKDRFGERNISNLHSLDESFVVDRVAEYFQANGKYPRFDDRSQVLNGHPGDTWKRYDSALRNGRRGLPGGSSVADLLERHFGVCNPMNMPELDERFIVDRLIQHKSEFGSLPIAKSNTQVLGGYPCDTWKGYNSALVLGCRGLPGGSSLSKLMQTQFGVRNHMNLPRLTEEYISDRISDHHELLGKYPSARCRKQVVGGYEGDTWSGYNASLAQGLRGLPGGSSLAKLLSDRFGVRNIQDLPRLDENQIVSLAECHFNSTGNWPNRRSGYVIGGSTGDTWGGYESALHKGGRGLPGGSSLAKLLAPLKNRHKPKDSG